MTLECFQRAALPTGPLIAEHAQRLGRFGPADRLRDEPDTIILFLLYEGSVQFDHQLHVFTDRPETITANLQDGVAPEQAKGP